MRFILLAAFCAALLSFSHARAEGEIPVEDFVKLPEFTSISLSPDGKYLALAAPDGDQTGMAILDITDFSRMKLTATLKFSSHEHVSRIWWVGEERVAFTTVHQAGTLNRPYPTGRLYAMNVDGTGKRLLIGSRGGTRYVARAFDIVDLLPEDEEHILLVERAHDRPRPQIISLDVYNGRQNRKAFSPLEGGMLYIDHAGQVRFAYNIDEEHRKWIAYRKDEDSEWKETSLENIEYGLNVHGFTADNKNLVVDIDRDDAMGFYRMIPETTEMFPLLISHDVEPSYALHDIFSDSPTLVGGLFSGMQPENRFFAGDDNPTVKLYKMLDRAFANALVTIVSATRDGRKVLVRVWSDRIPGDYYLFDTKTLKATYLLSSRPQIDPEKMAERKPIKFQADDGETIYGYLTLPPDQKPENLPLVTVVHGGPHGIRDDWAYDYEAQLLANRGYAVLQVNYRGSGGYGHEYETAGHRKWGTRIQADILNGVDWVIEQGIADPERLCVYGGSFGGYSVLAQLTTYPDKYQCGFAFVGVYDLNLMFEEGDIPQSDYGINYLNRVLGTDPEKRSKQSPINFVDRIKAALYVAHGEEDVRAHVAHYHALIEALEEKGIPHKRMLVEKEGHGFYKLENRVMLYEALIDFLDKHIGRK